MMNEQELLSDSESSDEEYKPTGIENDVSEEESGNESNEDAENDAESTNINRKRRKKNTSKLSSRKKIKNGRKSIDEDEDKEKKDEEIENSETSLTEEEQKKKSDQLWADFLSGTEGPLPKKSLVEKTVLSDSSSSVETSAPSVTPKPSISTVSTKSTQQRIQTNKILTFAGEEVIVDKNVDVTPETSSGTGLLGGRGRGRPTGGISSILGQLGKKGKLSTLEKSKLDWDSFKKETGIVEELAKHNKGKNGYLEKQDFLERTDLRQFEIEKNLRAAKRSLNR